MLGSLRASCGAHRHGWALFGSGVLAELVITASCGIFKPAQRCRMTLSCMPQDALAAIADRHAGLRTCFVERDGEVLQAVLPAGDPAAHPELHRGRLPADAGCAHSRGQEVVCCACRPCCNPVMQAARRKTLCCCPTACLHVLKGSEQESPLGIQQCLQCES